MLYSCSITADCKMDILLRLAFKVFSLCLIAATVTGSSIHHGRRHHSRAKHLVPEVKWVDSEDCGISKYPDPGEPQRKQSKIYGGYTARQGEFPWTVALLNHGTLECGAILINEDWILTAAHCVEEQEEALYNVTLGEHARFMPNSFRVSMAIDMSNIHIHPEFENMGHLNDIALLKMPQSIAFTENIRPACPPNTTRDVTGYMCTVTGWGVTGDATPKAAILQFANVPVVDHQQCSDWYNPDYVIIESMHLCAGYEEGEIDACTGDSGGPLACMFGDQFELHGIVSWGEMCAQPNYPGVYTRVVSYLDWIQQVMDAN